MRPCACRALTPERTASEHELRKRAGGAELFAVRVTLAHSADPAGGRMQLINAAVDRGNLLLGHS